MKRELLLKQEWFLKSKRLAIADVIYVKGIGVCSHQPELGKQSFEGHRMCDMEGNIHIVNDIKLIFMAYKILKYCHNCDIIIVESIIYLIYPAWGFSKVKTNKLIIP